MYHEWTCWHQWLIYLLVRFAPKSFAAASEGQRVCPPKIWDVCVCRRFGIVFCNILGSYLSNLGCYSSILDKPRDRNCSKTLGIALNKHPKPLRNETLEWTWKLLATQHVGDCTMHTQSFWLTELLVMLLVHAVNVTIRLQHHHPRQLGCQSQQFYNGSSLPSPPREARAVVEPPSLGDIFSWHFSIRPAPPPVKTEI